MPASSSRTAPIPPLGATASASTSRGNWTSGASSGAASSLRMPPISRASRQLRRRAGAGRGAGRQLLRTISHHRTAPAHCARERRAAETQPRDHRTPVQERQRVRARCPAGPDAVPEYDRCNSRARGQPAQAQNALNVLLARPPGPLPEMEAGREKIPTAELVGHRRPARRAAAPPTGRACGRDASRCAVGSDWRQ